MKLIAVPPEDVPLFWKLTRHHFQALVDQFPEHLTLEGFESRLVEGDYILLLMTEGERILMALCAEVVVADTGMLTLALPHCSGPGLDEYLPVLAEGLIDLADSLGCTYIRTIGSRPGWEKKLVKQYGGKVAQIEIEFKVGDLKNGR